MDIRQENILKYSNEILDYLLKFKERNPEFTFALRQRDSAQNKDIKRLETGQWFQGSHYIYIPLFRKGDNARKIKTIGFSIDFDSLGNITSNHIGISFKSGTEKKEEIEFHKKLANYISLELNEKNHGSKEYSNTQDIFTNLDSFITDFRYHAITLLEELGLKEEYVISETDFQKNLGRIEKIKSNDKSVSFIEENKVNYWVFQGNPKIFDFETALRKEILNDWTVTAHKTKIKTGDKVILWIGGNKAGCYALAEVTSEPHLKKSATDSRLWKEEDNSDLKADIRITHSLLNSPILKTVVDSNDQLKNLKVGSQGTNFSATADEYNILLNMTSNKKKLDIPLNQILYGPPGTGKTYNTVLEAGKIVSNNALIFYGEALEEFNRKLGNQIEFITFHQNYSYEDFIQGIRPDTENGKELSFEKKDGVFKRIADRALKNITDSEQPEYAKKDFDAVFQDFILPLIDEDEIEVKMKKTSFYITQISEKSIEFRKNQGDSQHTLSINTLRKMYNDGVNEIILGGLQPYYNPILQVLLEKGKSQFTPVEKKNFVIIIDEINRANISRVFGELITLIEEDKRSHGKIPMRVTLPSGDTFIVPSNLYIIGTMNTADKSIALLDIALRRRFEFVAKYPDTTVDGVHDGDVLLLLNKAIQSRKGYDFTIGHAYFMGDDYTLENTVNKKVIPLLLEYFMNNEDEVIKIFKEANITIGGWPLKMIL